MKLQPGYAMHGVMIHQDRNFNFTFDPNARAPHLEFTPTQTHRVLGPGVVAHTQPSVIRGCLSKDASLVSAVGLVEPGLRVERETRDSTQPPNQRAAAAGSAEASGGFRGRSPDTLPGDRAVAGGGSSPTRRAPVSPCSSSQDVTPEPSPGRPVSPSREYHGLPAVPHPTYPPPPPSLQHGVCLPIPPVSEQKFLSECSHSEPSWCVNSDHPNSCWFCFLFDPSYLGFFLIRSITAIRIQKQNYRASTHAHARTHTHTPHHTYTHLNV